MTAAVVPLREIAGDRRTDACMTIRLPLGRVSCVSIDDGRPSKARAQRLVLPAHDALSRNANVPLDHWVRPRWHDDRLGAAAIAPSLLPTSGRLFRHQIARQRLRDFDPVDRRVDAARIPGVFTGRIPTNGSTLRIPNFDYLIHGIPDHRPT
ncbi:hypothetical protein [Burkholderia vietnamiensis]|uniref:hypothetical protein n=1 Tax=Burkholderia vietnamiensis TaxID=60552 RepID=UPI000F80E022|nr:hypothetical protein [Burkholderia vietnamiensis]HDR9083355.1 hypothetical protein [Burkholderia vietnamiensis]